MVQFLFTRFIKFIYLVDLSFTLTRFMKNVTSSFYDFFHGKLEDFCFARNLNLIKDTKFETKVLEIFEKYSKCKFAPIFFFAQIF